MARYRAAFIHGFNANTGSMYWFICDDFNSFFATSPDTILELNDVKVNGIRKYKVVRIKKSDLIISSIEMLYARDFVDEKTKEQFFTGSKEFTVS